MKKIVSDMKSAETEALELEKIIEALPLTMDQYSTIMFKLTVIKSLIRRHNK